MPKAWSEEEREVVRQTLIQKGKELFERHGLRKTTVDEIAGQAGVSKGAFYLFFGSKEDLYFSILEAVEREFKDEVYRSLRNPEGSRRDSFKLFLRRTVDYLIDTPIYGRIDASDLQYLTRKLPADVVERHMKNDRAYLANQLGTWISSGWMRAVDESALTGVLLSLLYFVVHREDIGGVNFEASKELMIDMISEYLVPGN